MLNRRPYVRRLRVLSPWILKAIGLVVAGAMTMVVVVTIVKAVSFKSDSPRDGKFVGVRHDAATISSTGSTLAGVATSSSDQAAVANTIVRNGVTVVSPQLLVPVIDIDALETANGCEADTSSSKVSKPLKRAGYATHSSSRRHSPTGNKRWKAYGLALR
jgi:hypothetical protein